MVESDKRMFVRRFDSRKKRVQRSKVHNCQMVQRPRSQTSISIALGPSTAVRDLNFRTCSLSSSSFGRAIHEPSGLLHAKCGGQRQLNAMHARRP